jgi:hypothetical protein
MHSQSPLDRLWQEYSLVFRDFDDHSLARWLSQTLSQLRGRLWRVSHPLVGAYRLAAGLAHERQIWLKRLALPPAGYTEAECCRAPLVPLFTRDVFDSGLICLHCNSTVTPLDEFPLPIRTKVQAWCDEYKPIHAVAHWEDKDRGGEESYNTAFEKAAREAERILASAPRSFLADLLDHYPIMIWEDQDECLEVAPEDIQV